MNKSTFLPATLLLFFAAAHPSRAVESWADPRLTLTNDLFMWWDVSRQNAARGVAGLTPLHSWNDAPDFLLDGSGNHHHLSQPLLAARPKFRQEFNGAMLTFDGTDDFLAGTGLKTTLDEITIFLVAAPRAVGWFRGPLALNGAGRNDYTTGLNLDFGSPITETLARVNAEGAGFGGEANLLTEPKPLRSWHLFALTASHGPEGVRLAVNGRPQGVRPRASGAKIQCDDVVLGARHYSNTSDRPHAQGFFQGDLTEVLVYRRALKDAERAAVEEYLDAKYGALLRGITGAQPKEGAIPLQTLAKPPPVQVFLPGFSAREIPVELSNINNLRYRPDGKLVAVGYDGRIWLLSDTNGDTLEDRAEPFWDKQTLRSPIGAALTPPGYPRGDGVFVAAKEKLALVLDTNRDHRADEEITVASWKESNQPHGVDGLGVAVAPDGSIYFGIGTANFVEPYLIDRTSGQSRYKNLKERGTIQRVSPDFSKRETICTGVRYPVGLALNQLGDLFCTDQEGATWVPNGNPLDELLHIQKGRHYGFPARHPVHLPDVIDEPSVFDYVPQHQSTCGLQFNDPVNAGPTFGPPHWRGDALVAGYSRGKIWRTKVVKTEAGYVAQTGLIATLQALTVDMCVSPTGELVVATHSGQPDWGTGPTGSGKLWKIRYEHRDLPQPVAAWNASPTEVRIAFDRPVPAELLRDLSRNARLESGRYVAAGDRFETFRPGYQIVYDQLAAPRYAHEILSVKIGPDHRTFGLVTRPRPQAVNYAATLPLTNSATRQHWEIDLLTDCTGLEVSWQSVDAQESWTGWLPHADVEVAAAFTTNSAEHDVFRQCLERPGMLRMRAQLDLSNMLVPAVQPGSTIDWQPSAENVTVRFSANKPLKARFGDQVRSLESGVLEHTFVASGQKWQPLELELETGPGATLTAHWSTAQDPRARAFPLRRFLLPWAQPAGSETTAPTERKIPEIAGGNWMAGRRLFFGEKLGCSKCHAIRAEGVSVGPDLSNLLHRDFASVRQDIEKPNAALNPDHIASVIELDDGDSINALIRGEKEGVLQLAMGSGVTEMLPRSKVKKISPANLSLMPEGLWTGLTETDQRDLMTFLLTSPLDPHPLPAEIQGQKMPAARKLAELPPEALAPPANTTLKNLRIVLCASPKDPGHGAPGFHDYPLWRERWSRLLALAEGVTVETADRWPSDAQWDQADLIAFYHDNPAWSGQKAQQLDAFLERGGGLVFLHWAVNAPRDVATFAERIGMAWGPGARFRYGLEPLQFAPHEITSGFTQAEIVDESYWKLTAGAADSKILATTLEEGQPQPQVWIRSHRQGRVFVCIPGHFTWTFDDPLFRVLVLRGMAWAASQPVNRFLELTTVGARFQQ